MRLPSHILLIAALLVAAGCSKEPPPRTVSEFMENELLLEAALVRCRQNRAETRYEAECVNAREAANLIEAREGEERRAELEAQSEAKREALRRNQEAAAEARRLAAEAQQQRQDAEYLSQFGELPPTATTQELVGNAPGVVISQDPSATGEDGGYETGGVYVAPYPVPDEQSSQQLPTAGSNAPTVQAEPMPEPTPAPQPAPLPVQQQPEPQPEPEPEAVVEVEEQTPNDLQSIRDELRRRNDDGSN